jgi:4-carboxymuconolactone decarboxylase
MEATVLLNENAVLGDEELKNGLMSINPEWGEFCIRVSGEAWGKPLIDQRTKALIAIAVDIIILAQDVQFGNHIKMAMKQGVTREELEELFFFMSIYAGFNKAGVYYELLDRVLGPKSK